MSVSAVCVLCAEDEAVLSQALMNYLWLGKTLRESIKSPVVYVDGKNELSFEPAFDKVLKHHNTHCGVWWCGQGALALPEVSAVTAVYMNC